MSSPTQNIKTELSTASKVQNHCPIQYEKVRSLILVWYSGTVQSFKPQHATLTTTPFITRHTTDELDACRMQKQQCTLYSSLAQSTAGLNSQYKTTTLNISHTFPLGIYFSLFNLCSSCNIKHLGEIVQENSQNLLWFMLKEHLHFHNIIIVNIFKIPSKTV